MSDEFVDVLLGKLAEALRPGPFDALEEATMNAALAIIHSMQPQSELQALLAVQIIATGFSGLRFASTEPTTDDGGLHRRLRQLRHQAAAASK